MTSEDRYRRKLIRQLRGAYSGELAAGHAYRGHARSVRDETQRARIRVIEAEEWHHRELVGGLLRELNARPSMFREAILWLIGNAISILCRIGGWFVPMYGAGRLERTNIVEYEDAAFYALMCGRKDMIECLLSMAEVEWEHERTFRDFLRGHWLLRFIRMWEEPPPKASIRANYATRKLA